VRGARLAAMIVRLRSVAGQMMRQYELVEKVQKYDATADEALLNRAYVYAMKAHNHQKRASGDPYFSHPLEVAAILTDLKLDDATIATALLHDVIEDTDATRAEIDHLFGPEIGALVDGLTKIKRLDLVSKEAAQAENFRKLLIAISTDIRVLLVKLADRLHNMRTMEHMKPDSRRRISEETLDIYAPLAGRMGMQAMREELEDLAFRWLHPEAYATVMGKLKELREVNEGLVDEIATALQDKLAGAGMKADVNGREKKPYSIWRKMANKQISLEQLSDIYAFRVICDSIDDCYRVLGVAHTTWRTVPGRFKDYISTPKQNNYQSIHTTVVGPLQGWPDPQRQWCRKGLRQRQRPLRLAAPPHRHPAGGLQPGGISRAYQAGAVPGPSILLQPERPAHRPAAWRYAARLRLCGAHRHRQFGGRGLRQWPACSSLDDAAQRRRGGDPDLAQSHAAGGMGSHRGHRTSAFRHPPRGSRCGAAQVLGAWAAAADG
jgi:hypothetical protein